MVTTRARQAKAGPSKRAKPLLKFDSIIDLTDSEDENSVKSCPAKRRRTVLDVTIDLTPSSPTLAKSVVNAEYAKGPIEDGHEKAEEKSFEEVTNALGMQHTQQDPTPANPLDVDEGVQETPEESMDRYLSQVLEVIPDVQPEHARSLLIQYQPTYGTDVVAAVLHELFEHPYPQIERNKGKRKREDNDIGEEHGGTSSKDYSSRERPFEGGGHYKDLAMTQLTIDFPRIPVPHIRETMRVNNFLYAPAHFSLRDQLTWDPTPFTLKKTPTKPSGKGKQHDPEFERELAWLVQVLRNKAVKCDAPSQEGDESDGECEDGVECGCCFSKYVFDKMVQCPDAHLFCKGCMRSYAGNLLGQQDPNIVCMDQSGCKLAFAEAELRRFLSPKLLELYERVKQTKEIEAAGLDGLEECPFCDYKVVIENPDEKLFHCQREECGSVTCRVCKKVDHLPKSCKEAEEDRGLNARHKVEEAMTVALMRNCPKCKKAFIKEGGCNKMTCPNCRTLSCYICRQIINGYDHFDSRTPGQTAVGQASGSGQKCLLWDPVEQRHDQEVAAAREKAIKEAENADPGVDAKQLEVELRTNIPVANNVRVGRDQPRAAAAQAMPRLGFIRGFPVNPNPLQRVARERLVERHEGMRRRVQEALARRERERALVQQRNEATGREVAERQNLVRRQFEVIEQRRQATLARRQQIADQLREAERHVARVGAAAASMAPGPGQGHAPVHLNFFAPNNLNALPPIGTQGPHAHAAFPFVHVPPPQLLVPQIVPGVPPGMTPGMQAFPPGMPGGIGPLARIPTGTIHPLPPAGGPQQPVPQVFHFPGVLYHPPGHPQLPAPLHVRREGH